MTLQFEGVGFGAGPGSGGKIGTVALVAMGSQPSTPYTVGSKWFYNGLIYTATSTTTTDGGVTPSYDTAYLFNGTYYYWDGSTLQGADESNLVHITGTETITGNKTFSGSVALGDNASAQTKPTSDTSDALATTKFVKNFDDAKEWTPPSDWIDIRSGALPRSIYLLVGHASDYSSYRYFDFHVILSDTTHNYKVYIDYQLFGTYASGADVMIDWQTLALTSGKATTSPENLVAHVIRIVPENDADTIAEFDNVRYESSGNEAQGILWAHFTQNELERVRFCSYSKNYQPLLVAITALDDNLHLTGTNQQEFLGQGQDLYARRSSYLAKLPTIEVDTLSISNGMFSQAGPLKKIKIKVNNSFTIGSVGTYSCASCFSGNTEQIEINKPIITTNEGTNHDKQISLFRASKIKEIPLIDYSKAVNLTNFLANCTNLKPTILDLRDAIYLTKTRMFGTSSSVFISGLKGLLVSNQAPFDNATAPQIEVNYTGLDREALVNLFKSLPYNVRYTIHGTLVNNDGIFSGFSNDNYISVSRGSMTSWEGLEIVVSSPTGFVSNSGTQAIFAKRDDIYLYITAGGYLQYYDGNNHNIYQGESGPAKKVKLKFTDSQVLCYYSLDGTEFILGVTVNALPSTFKTYSPFAFGARSYGSAYAGEIDMPNSYIKRNDLPYFVGDGINRSISVVGATGTADLTAEDKAIAEDKGWSIVLA